MANSTFIQFRTSEEDKREVTEILDQLGISLSTLLNMTIKQVILQRGIPFEVALPKENAKKSPTKYVAATMALEDMALDEKEIDMLDKYHKGELSAEEVRRTFLAELGVSHE